MSARIRAVPTSAWVIIAGALLLRVAIVLLTDNRLGADAAEYDRFARSIADGSGYPDSSIAQTGPTAFFPPLYPYLLGVVYWLTGDSITAARLVQSLLGVILVGLIGFVAYRVWTRRIALVAMATAAVYPPFLLGVTTVLSEPLFLVFEMAALAAVLQHRVSDHRYRWVVIAGALVGLATLTRANGLLLLVPLAFGVITPGRFALRRVAPYVLALLLPAVLIVAPWSIRNTIDFDRFVPFTTQPNLALARNYNPQSEAVGGLPQTTEPLVALTRTQDDEAEIASRAGSMARDYIEDHPGYFAETVGRNTLRALGLSDGRELAQFSAEDEGASTKLADVGIYSFYVFAVLALIGAFTREARRAPWWMWAVPVLIWLSVVWLAAGRTRYRLPVDPFVIMLASLAIVDLWQRLGERYRARRTATS